MPNSRFFFSGLFFFALSWQGFSHYRPWVNFHSEWLAFLGLAGLLISVLRQSSFIELPVASCWIALVIVLPWLQYLSGINYFAGDALMSSLYLSGLLVAVGVGYAISRKDSQLKHGVIGLMHSIWIAAMISAAIGLAQWLNVDGMLGMYAVHTDPGDRAMGNLGQPNQLATLLLMGMAAYAYVYQQKIIGRFSFSIGILFLSVVLVLSQSRAGLLSVFFIAGFLIWKSQKVSMRLTARLLALWAVGVLVGTLLLPFISDALLLGGTRSVSSSSSVSERWLLWKQMAAAVAQSPWFGYGWNQTAAAQSAAAADIQGSTPFTYAHNLFIDLIVWNGLPLGLLLSGAVAYWLISRVSICVRKESIYAMASLLPVFIHSMLEYPFAYSYFLIAAGLMVGIVEAGATSKNTLSLKVRWGWGFLALWSFLGAFISYEYVLIEEDFRVVRFQNLHIGKTPETYVIPHVWVLSHMAAMLNASRLVIEPNMKKADIESLKQVSLRFSNSPISCRFVIALGLNGEINNARHQLPVVRGLYGQSYHSSCKAEIYRLEKDQYPQLADVLAP